MYIVELTCGWKLSLQTRTAGLLLPLGASMTHTGADRFVTWHICSLASGYFKHKEKDQNQTQAAGKGNLKKRCDCHFSALYNPLTVGLIKFHFFQLYSITLLHRLSIASIRFTGHLVEIRGKGTQWKKIAQAGIFLLSCPV